MKRAFVVALGLTVVCLALQAWAQQPGSAPLPYSKVGMVNMGKVYTKYKKVDIFKQEMERDVAPFKKQKEELDRYITLWQNALSNPKPKEPLTEKQKQEGIQVIISCKRKLEDLEMEYKRVMGKKFEDQMVQLSKEVTDAVERHARAHGYHLIMAYGEPEKKLPALTDFTRKMKVIDAGGITLSYCDPSLDISDAVLTTLNAPYTGGQPVGQK